MFITFIVIMVHAYVQIHWILYIKCVQFCIAIIPDKAVKNEFRYLLKKS